VTNTTVVPGFAWSYSQLKNYETCPKRYYHYNVAKDVKEPESDNMREGWALHKAFELRVKNNTPLPLGMTQYEKLIVRILSQSGQVYAEQKLAMTSSFTPTAYFAKDVWCRSQLDFTSIKDTTATTLDWKTGKPKEDLTQMQIASAMLMCHMPSLQRVKVGLVFVGHGQVESGEFTRDDLTEIWGELLPRVKAVEKARATAEYPPKPSGLCKRYCAVVSCPHHGR
jgi:hypothetical protein